MIITNSTPTMTYNASATVFVGDCGEYCDSAVYGGQFTTDRFDHDRIFGSDRDAAESFASDIYGACATAQRADDFALAPVMTRNAARVGAAARFIFRAS